MTKWDVLTQAVANRLAANGGPAMDFDALRLVVRLTVEIIGMDEDFEEDES